MGIMHESFIFYRSFYESIKELPADMQVEVIHAISEYSLYGETIQMSPVCKALFTAFCPSIQAAKTRYEACVENGKRGASYGNRGGRPRKRTPVKTPNETPKDEQNGDTITPNVTPKIRGYKPLTVTVTDTDTGTELVSKKVSKERELLNLTGARAFARESYEEILDRLGFSEVLKKQVFKFVQFLQANKKVVTNDMLEKILKSVQSAAERRIRSSLPSGIANQMRADLSGYRDDIDGYILESIQQALDGQWFELKEPKQFKTAAEWEREAMEDLQAASMGR